jgi:tRNA-modifying protein YgfZ
MPTSLPPPQMLTIAGADAVAFAHAQFCNDVIALRVGSWQWNAWLSPAGRVRYFFLLWREAEDRLHLLLRGGEADAMRAALMRFVFRAKLSLHTPAGMQALGGNESETQARLGTLPEGDSVVQQGDCAGLRLPGPAPRWLLLQASGPSMPAASTEALNGWRLEDIRSGLPELAPALEDQMLPQWLGLGRLQAISVGKGCYPGQEIMARLHFKGGNKRGLYRLQLRCAALPAPGTPLFDASQETGTIVMAAWSAGDQAEALAVLADAASSGPVNTQQTVSDAVNVVSGFS